MLGTKGIISGLPTMPKGFFKGGLSIGGVKVVAAEPKPAPAGPCGAYDETKGMTDWPTASNSDIIGITNNGIAWAGKDGRNVSYVDVELKQIFETVKGNSDLLWKGILKEFSAAKGFKYYLVTGWTKAKGCRMYYTNHLAEMKSLDKHLNLKKHDPPKPKPVTFDLSNSSNWRNLFKAPHLAELDFALKEKTKFTVRGLEILLNFKTYVDSGKYTTRPLHTNRGKAWFGPYSGVFSRYQNGTDSWTALWWCFVGGNTDKSWKRTMSRSGATDAKEMFDYQWNWFQSKRGTRWSEQGLSTYDCMSDPWYWPDGSENDFGRRGRGDPGIHPKRDQYFKVILQLWEYDYPDPKGGRKPGLGWQWLKKGTGDKHLEKLRRVLKIEGELYDSGCKLVFQGVPNRSTAGTFTAVSYGFCTSISGGGAGSVKGLASAAKPAAVTKPSSISGSSASGGTNKTMSRSF